KGDPSKYRLPRPMLHDGLDLSMSGLKTAVVNAVRGKDLDAERADIARGFQDAVIDVVTQKVLRAVQTTGRPRVVLGGGVACNKALKEAMRVALAEKGATLHAPTPRISTDNAAMIARAGLFRANEAGRIIDADARLPFPGLTRPGT